jgi:hypothetical protein
MVRGELMDLGPFGELGVAVGVVELFRVAMAGLSLPRGVLTDPLDGVAKLLAMVASYIANLR